MFFITNATTYITATPLLSLKTRLKLLFFLACFLFTYAPTLSAQADSLLRVYQNAKTGKEELDGLLKLSRFYINSYDSTNGKLYTQQLIDVAASQKDTLMLMEGLNSLGNIHHQHSDFKDARLYHQATFDLAKASHNVERMALMQYNIGNDYLSLGEISKALQTYIEGATTTENCDCPSAKFYLNAQLASLYSEQLKDNQTALVWGKRALTYTEPVQKGRRTQILKVIASFYLASNQLDSARYFSDMAYQGVLNTNNKGQKADILYLKSDIEAHCEHPALALEYAQKADEIAKELPDKGLKGKVLMALGNAFLLRGDVKQAQKALLSAEKYLLEEPPLAYSLPRLYNALAKTEEWDNPKRAIDYLKKSTRIQDSLDSDVHNNQVAIFSMQSENSLKEAENRQLRTEAEAKEKRFRILTIPFAIVTLLLILALYLYRKIRAQNTELLRLNELSNQQNNALTASNQRMEWFTETLSHDALGYINNVLNYANFGKNAHYSKELTTILEKIHKNAVNLKKMSLNLILFKKTGEIANTSNVNLTDVVAEVIEDMGEELTHNPVQLDAQDLPTVYADKEFTKQIFRNILSNAVKFKQPNAELNVVISGVETGDFVHIQVKDSGIGIPTDKLSSVFEEFTQLNKKAEGSGLGLFICQQTVEVMGGKIWAERRLEGGTAIHFTLPAAK